MNFKIISEEQVNQLYPNNYDTTILKSYSLMDWKLNTTFRYYYSCYHYYLDEYLKSVLNLQEINDKIKELNLQVELNSLYKEISTLDLECIFIRNNIFLDRLSKDEFELFTEYYKNKDIIKIGELVKNTYKKLIRFDFNIGRDKVVNYDPLYGSMLTLNNALVIGISAKEDAELNSYIKEKEIEFSNILEMPVKIFIFDGENKKDTKVTFVENLNIQNEQKQKAILDMYPKYLPLGSIVVLKNGWKKLMIMGYSAINMDTKDKIYDYIACLYPEGVIQSNYNILFNHEDIRSIYALGLVDDEQKDFMSKIDDLIGSDEHQKEVLKQINEDK